MTSPFDGRHPFDTDARRASLEAREQREDEQRELVHCVLCGDACVDHGGERPKCETCDRQVTYGVVIDTIVGFFWQPAPKKRRRKAR
jgi:hypothetical protein